MKLMRPFVVKAANLLSSNVAEANPLYNPATSYAADFIVRDDAAGGTFEYKSLAGSNVGNPLNDPAKWFPLGPSNRWKSLDGKITAQTENADSVEHEIKVDGRIDGVSVLNVEAASVQVVAVDDDDGEIFNETVSLVSTYGIIDIYAYLTEPIERLTDKFIPIPRVLYADLTVTVTIAAPGSTAKVGEVIPSLSREIGITGAGASIGIRDYSRKAEDDFGNVVVVQRAFSKRANFTVLVAASMTDQVQTLLSRYRATPIVYLGATEYGSTLVYGYYRDFSEEIQGPSHTICTIEVEGLSQ